MGNPSAMSVRYIELLRAGWGAGLLAAPETVLERVHGLRVDRKAVVVARILGARHLIQAGLSGASPSPERLAGGVWVDTVHALTALGLAAIDRDRARAGVTDGVIAGVWAGFGVHDLRTTSFPPSSSARLDRLARRVFAALPGGEVLMSLARRRRM